MKRPVVIYVLASLACLLACVVGLSAGDLVIGPREWLEIVAGHNEDTVRATILFQLRLPRVLGACLVGAALSSAGAAFQGLFRNALAEPYIIGASSGAALGVALAMVLGIQSTLAGLGATTAMAMVGSIGVVALVLAVGSAVRSVNTTTLLLAGIAISSLVNSLVSALMILNDPRAVAVLAWVMGSLAGTHWTSLGLAVGICIPSITVIYFSARALDAFSLGEVTAQSLGLNISSFRWVVVVAASLATAAAVSIAGIVGFVGLVAPHIARQLVGASHRAMLPLSAVIGSTLMVLADTLSRVVMAPGELPVGIVTAVVGSPFFLWLLLAKRPERGRRNQMAE